MYQHILTQQTIQSTIVNGAYKVLATHQHKVNIKSAIREAQIKPCTIIVNDVVSEGEIHLTNNGDIFYINSAPLIGSLYASAYKLPITFFPSVQ